MSDRAYAIVADITEPGKGLGCVRELPAGGDALDFRFTREAPNRWVLFAGSADEISTQGSTLAVASPTRSA